MKQTFIISPHLDDAAFSLGGVLSKNIFDNVTIVNVFTKSCYTISGIKDSVWVTETRLNEDNLFVKSINGSALYLGYPDSSLKECYASEADYFNPNIPPQSDPDWNSYSKEVIEIVEGNPDVLYLFPIGMGRHIEHRALSWIGAKQLELGRNMIFYEDGTYFSTRFDEGALLAKSIGLNKSFSFYATTFEDKKIMIDFYKTQLNGIILRNLEVAFKVNGEKLWSTADIFEKYHYFE